MASVGFRYGVLSDKLSEQAKEQGYELDEAERLEEFRYALNLLRIHGILTDSQCDKAYPRLQKMVVRRLKPIKKESEEVKNGTD